MSGRPRPFSRTALIEKFNAGEQLTFIPFWNEVLPDTRAYYNQWHPAEFKRHNFWYTNAEQAMMAEKALTFNDLGTLVQILATDRPMVAKSLGRAVKGYVDSSWAAVRLSKVILINIDKFSQNPIMLEALRATGDSVLVEASPVDSIWGIGLTGNDPRVHNPTEWRGTNLLGEALMEVRDLLCNPLNGDTIK